MELVCKKLWRYKNETRINSKKLSGDNCTIQVSKIKCLDTYLKCCLSCVKGFKDKMYYRTREFLVIWKWPVCLNFAIRYRFSFLFLKIQWRTQFFSICYHKLRSEIWMKFALNSSICHKRLKNFVPTKSILIKFWTLLINREFLSAWRFIDISTYYLKHPFT